MEVIAALALIALGCRRDAPHVLAHRSDTERALHAELQTLRAVRDMSVAAWAAIEQSQSIGVVIEPGREASEAQP